MSRRVLMALVILGAFAAPARADDGMFDDCARCHTAKGWQEIKPSAATALDHAKTGFPLLGRHTGLTCDRCHRPDLDLSAPWAGACVVCHQDTEHRGALGEDCAECHASSSWRVPRGRAIHAPTRFPLTGAHLVAECVGCHRRADRRHYSDAPIACDACHMDDYNRPNTSLNHITGAISLDCARCHRTLSWSPSTFRHARFFPLRGAHRPLDCETCHVGNRFGGTPSTCDGCHMADHHRAAHPDHTTAGFSRRCDGCHTEVGWIPARADWHDSFFPITRGKHRGLRCAECHPASGSFAVFRCMPCHERDETRAEHDDVSGFVLDDAACLECHPTGTE